MEELEFIRGKLLKALIEETDKEKQDVSLIKQIPKKL
jgi:hypothetical protein